LKTAEPAILFGLTEGTIRKYSKKGPQKPEPPGQHPLIAAEAGSQTFHGVINEHEQRKMLANNESLQYVSVKHKPNLDQG
jgi:hypothetical protein